MKQKEEYYISGPDVDLIVSTREIAEHIIKEIATAINSSPDKFNISPFTRSKK